MATVCVFPSVAAASSDGVPEYDVQARFDAPTRRLQVTTTVRIPRSQRGKVVRLWCYACRLSREPEPMNYRNARWVYPGQVDLSWVKVTDVRVGQSATPWKWMPVKVPLAPAVRPAAADAGDEFWGRAQWAQGKDLVVDLRGRPDAGVVTVRWHLRVPNRFGRFGEVNGRVTLAAPWYPLLLSDDGSWWRTGVHRVSLTVRGEGRAMLSGFGSGAATKGRLAEPASAVSVRSRGPFVAAHVAARWWTYDDGPVRVVSDVPLYRDPPPGARGLAAVRDVLRMDVPKLLARAAREVNATWRLTQGTALPAPVGQVGRGLSADRHWVIMVPHRTELAGWSPGATLVSDRVFEVLPVDPVRDFHRRAVQRALFRTALLGAGRPHDGDGGWESDLRAAWLVQVDGVRAKQGDSKSLQELVGFAAFHPSVDSLLYAQQVPFADVYFGGATERDPFREDPVRARVPHARGGELLTRIRTMMTPKGFRELAPALSRWDKSLRASLPVHMRGLGGLDEWLRFELLPVNYRLGEVRSRRAGDGYVHRVRVHRDGSRRSEPVLVMLVDNDGVRHRQVWNGHGREAVLTFRTASDVDLVEVDPDKKLDQTAALADGHPRGDDTTHTPWRPPLLRALGLNVSVAERRVTGFVDFALRRRYNLERAVAVDAVHTTARTGGGIQHIWGVGPKRHNNARIGFVSAGARFARLDESFARRDVGGWRWSAVGGVGANTQFFDQDPRKGWATFAGGRLSLVLRDDQTVVPTGSVGGRFNWTVPMGLHNATLFVGGLGWTFGDALASEHQSLGGARLLRGFETDEALGNGAGFFVVEHRWTAFRNLHGNLFHLAWLREVQLAAFSGVGLLVQDLNGQDVRAESEVGAGVRLHFDYGGVQPGVFSADVSVPWTRSGGEVGSDGVRGRSRLPVGIFVSFDKFF